MQPLGGDHANMRGPTTPSKPGYIPPPTAPLQGIGGDYGIMNDRIQYALGQR